MANIFQMLGLVVPVEEEKAETSDLHIQSRPPSPDPDLDFSMSEQEATKNYLEVAKIQPDENYQQSILIRAYKNLDNDNPNETIFKVDEIVKSLPSTLPKEDLQKAIISILKSFNIDPQVIREDGEERILALDNMVQSEGEQIRNSISNREEEIETCKKRISWLEKEIQACKEMKEDLNRITKDETDRIYNLLGVIIGGDEDD